MFDCFFSDKIIAPAVRERILRELRPVAGDAAGVDGIGAASGVDARVRSARKLTVSSEIRQLIAGRFERMRPSLEQHFHLALSGCEEPQFLRYLVGDYFVAHQDGNTPLIRDDSVHRKISAVVFLNSQSVEPREGAYGGGSLLIHGRYPDFDQRYSVPPAAGSFVAFRAETTHEVTPVTHGERYTVVSWYR